MADAQGRLTGLAVKQRGQLQNIECQGVFVFIGLKPATEFLSQLTVDLDDNGFVITDKEFRTNLAGLFCAGDVRSGATMQIASAVGEGASAALAIRHYLEELET